jgi:hypothetical protein
MLRAILSCMEQMTQAAKQALQRAATTLYEDPLGMGCWLALVRAKGLDILDYLGPWITRLAEARWIEVRPVLTQQIQPRRWSCK